MFIIPFVTVVLYFESLKLRTICVRVDRQSFRSLLFMLQFFCRLNKKNIAKRKLWNVVLQRKMFLSEDILAKKVTESVGIEPKLISYFLAYHKVL